jgi:hypothetical protein
MAKLFPTLPLSPGEIPASYVGRVARLHGREPRLFCTDFGVTIQSVIDAQPETLTKIEDLAGLPPGTLGENAIHRTSDGYRFKQEPLNKSALRRERAFVCTACLAEDVAASSGPPIVSAYIRSIWSLASIRTCHVHNLALYECGVAGGHMRGDYASVIEPLLDNITEAAASAMPRPASSLERYIINRLGHGPGPDFADQFDLTTLAKFCELLGALLIHGSDFAATSLSSDDWQIAGGVGFDIVSRGESAIKDAISKAWKNYPNKKVPNQGAQAILGPLEAWLRAKTPEQEPFIDIIFRHITETLPVGPGDTVLGRPVPVRRFHSIYTASKEYGIHPKTARKYLAVVGALPNDHETKTDHACLFDAAAYADLLARIATSKSLKDVEAYLGAGRVYAKLLHDHGFIKPFISTDEKGVGEHVFAKDDLDDFLVRLLDGSDPVVEFKPPIYPIAEASRRANRSAAEVVAAILNNRLIWRGHTATAKGFSSVLVNLDEVKRVLADPESDAIPKSTAHLHLGTSNRVILQLINEGVFTLETIRNPKNRCPMMAIPKIQIQQFKEKYISLHELAKQNGAHPFRLSLDLKALGVMPMFDRTRISATFYLRSTMRSSRNSNEKGDR